MDTSVWRPVRAAYVKRFLGIMTIIYSYVYRRPYMPQVALLAQTSFNYSFNVDVQDALLQTSAGSQDLDGYAGLGARIETRKNQICFSVQGHQCSQTIRTLGADPDMGALASVMEGFAYARHEPCLTSKEIQRTYDLVCGLFVASGKAPGRKPSPAPAVGLRAKLGTCGTGRGWAVPWAWLWSSRTAWERIMYRREASDSGFAAILSLLPSVPPCDLARLRAVTGGRIR